MTSKRKRDVDPERRAKRRRRRSTSEPPYDTESPEKRQALNRLFGRLCTVVMDKARQKAILEFLESAFDDEDNESVCSDENEDPLLDTVPVDMDPEQLGFLVCAQETLRFLFQRGVPPEHPVMARLRSRFRRGIDQMALA